MTDTPILFNWDGEAMRPATSFWARRADQHYVIGQSYELVEHQERSSKSHAHYFATVHNTWLNLPEALAVEYPNAEKLRKHALIKAGFSDSQTHVCASKAEAHRLSLFLRPIDEFSIVTVTGSAVTRYTAKSQSMRAMGKDEFQRSKEAVLEILAGMIGTDVKALAKNSEAA